MTPANLNLIPAHDEFQIVVFGPGYGECILVHVGQGKWVVVDSCLITNPDTPAAIWYFDQLGLKIEECVFLVVATHWHDDHVAGISEVFKASKNARLACPVAINSKEFTTLIGYYAKGANLSSTGITELSNVVAECERRSTAKLTKPPVWCVENRPLIVDGCPPNVAILPLSPSDAAITKALNSFAKQVPQIAALKGRLSSRSPNHSAIALQISTGNSCVLLGSDLEVTADKADGWDRVVAARTNATLSTIHKVPHHGSKNAYHLAVWANMLTNAPLAIVTPFDNGGVRLPTDQDRDVIRSHTSNGYLTSESKFRTVSIPDRAVSDMVKAATKGPLRSLVGAPNFVRATKKINDTSGKWNVETFGNVVPV